MTPCVYLVIIVYSCICQKKVVPLRGEKYTNIMKTIIVSLDVFLGYTHHGYVSKTHNVVIEVSDDVAVILQDLQTHLECPLTDEDITSAIKKKKQLQPLKELHEILMTRCYDLETLHWSEDYCYQVSDSRIKKSFKQDIEDGLYTPQPDDEDYKGRLYFSKCQEHYFQWIFDNAVNDVWFSYARTGFDPCCMVQTGTYTYQILNIE